MERVSVRIPATSANMGPGFDSFGCALSLYNVYTFEILEGEGYKFIESKSSRIPKYKYSGDATESFAPVVDGAIFD